MKIILSLAIFFCANCFAQIYGVNNSWKKIFENERHEVFIDRNSVQRITNTNITSNGFVFIDMINAKFVFFDSGHHNSSARMAFIDCANPRYKVNAASLYRGQYGTGSTTNTYGPAAWVPISKSSDEVKVVYQYFCGN